MKVNSSFKNYKNPHAEMKTLGLHMLYLSIVSIIKPSGGTNIPLYCRQKKKKCREVGLLMASHGNKKQKDDL